MAVKWKWEVKDLWNNLHDFLYSFDWSVPDLLNGYRDIRTEGLTENHTRISPRYQSSSSNLRSYTWTFRFGCCLQWKSHKTSLQLLWILISVNFSIPKILSSILSPSCACQDTLSEFWMTCPKILDVSFQDILGLSAVSIICLLTDTKL